MSWILQRYNDLKTRVYLAKFLVEVKIPPEMLTLDEIKDTYAQYKQLQHDFKMSHQTVTQLRDTVTAPATLKKDIMDLEKEKEQLKSKIEDQKKKISSFTNEPEKLIQAASLLRRELDDETKLQDSRMEQIQLLERIEKRFRSMTQQLDSSSGKISIEAILKRLDPDKLATDISEYSFKLNDLKKLNSMSPNSATGDVEQDIQGLRDEIAELKEKLSNMTNQYVVLLFCNLE